LFRIQVRPAQVPPAEGKRRTVHAQQTVTITPATLASLILSPGGRLVSRGHFAARNGEIEQPRQFERKKYVNAEESQKVADAFRKANQAFQKEDYRAGAASLEIAYSINPEDDLIINFIAESYAMLGDRVASLMWLRRLLAVSPCFFHLPETDTPVLNSTDGRDLTLAAQATVFTNGRRRAWLSETHSSTSRTVNLAPSIPSNERFHKNIYVRLRL
jgi:hypothetical protein